MEAAKLQKLTKWVAERITGENWQIDQFREWYNRAPSPQVTWPDIEQVVDEASRQIKAARQAEAQQRKEILRQKLASKRQILRERDNPLAIPPALLASFEKVLRDELPEDVLADYNGDLAASKSQPITYRDIAFIGLIHRDSVTNNGKRQTGSAQYQSTSPFKRIAKASIMKVSGKAYREIPFDNRQIRYALTILEALGFTEQTTPSTQRTAGKWTINEDGLWNLFRNNPQFPT